MVKILIVVLESRIGVRTRLRLMMIWSSGASAVRSVSKNVGTQFRIFQQKEVAEMPKHGPKGNIHGKPPKPKKGMRGGKKGK